MRFFIANFLSRLIEKFAFFHKNILNAREGNMFTRKGNGIYVADVAATWRKSIKTV